MPFYSRTGGSSELLLTVLRDVLDKRYPPSRSGSLTERSA